MTVAKSFVRGLMIGSLQISLVAYCCFIAAFFLMPGRTQAPEKVTRSSTYFDIMNNIILTGQIIKMALFCCDLPNFLQILKEISAADVERWGRKTCYMFIAFCINLLLRVIYEIQMKFDCYDIYDPLTCPLVGYLQIFFVILPVVFNVIFMISYGLLCMHCENAEIIKVHDE